MKALLAPLFLAAAPALAQDLPPSGVMPALFDLILEPEIGLARVRFLRADLAALGQPAVADDFLWLCENVALPELRAEGWEAALVVISLHDREVPFGATDPAATQYFEGYRIEGDSCIWEPF